MAREFTTQSINDINSTLSDGVFLVLMTITHDNMTPIYVVNNTEAITSNGQAFLPYAFNIVLAGDDGEKIPQLRLTIDNVDRMLVDEIRGLATPPTITVEIIEASRPDTVELAFPNMTLRNVVYDAQKITGSLVVAELLSLRFPADRVNATEYAGLY